MTAGTPAARRRVQGTAWTQVVLGLLVVLAPFLAAPQDFRWWHWNAWIVGALVFALGLLAAISPFERAEGGQAGASLQLLLGLWLVIAAVMGKVDSVFFVLTVLLGAVVVAVAAYSTRGGSVEAGGKTA